MAKVERGRSLFFGFNYAFDIRNSAFKILLLSLFFRYGIIVLVKIPTCS